MEEKILTGKVVENYGNYLHDEEKSERTIEKYLRDVTAFAKYCPGMITKEKVLAYKQYLIDTGYAIRSINSMLSSLNSIFSFLGWEELRIKTLKIQHETFYPEEKELTKKEYERLCMAAEKNNNERLSLLLQTICCTGIRVSELKFITVEAVQKGRAIVLLKGKVRYIFLVSRLQKKLLLYIEKHNITTGAVFITRTGKLLGRTAIWREMKKICIAAGVCQKKVFPHNLRHLFARVFYDIEKDIAKLADLLGHSSINTTRIYITSTGVEHRKCMERMQLII